MSDGLISSLLGTGYIRSYKEKDDGNKIEIQVHIVLPTYYGNYEGLDRLLSEYDVPVDSIKDGLLNANRTYQGSSEQLTFYKLRVSSDFFMETETIRLKAVHSGEDISQMGHIPYLINAIKDYIGLYDQKKKNLSPFEE